MTTWIVGLLGAYMLLTGFDATDRDIPDNLRPWAIVVGLLVMAGAAAYELIDRHIGRD